MAMYDNDYSQKAIAKTLEVHPSTLRRWFREAGMPPKKNGYAPNPKPHLDPDPLHTALDDQLNQSFEGKTQNLEKDTQKEALSKEADSIAKVAVAQSTPAEKYQSFMAAHTVRLMRDGLQNIRPPSNVREMEVLDKIARRHFGLDGKDNQGASSLSIDISILNNSAAGKAAAVKIKPTQTIEIP